MPTNNKTALGLNSWVGTDKPMRADFVADNVLLDSLLTGHFNDTQKHLSPADRALLTEGFVLARYTGNGAGSQDITLPFEAKIVIVYGYRKPAASYNAAAGYNECSFAVITPLGGMQGVYLDGNILTVCQSAAAQAAGGTLCNLNASGAVYFYAAFR